MKKENVLKAVAASLGFLVVLFVSQILVPFIYQGYYYLAYSELRTTDYEAFVEQAMAFMQANEILMGLLSFILFFIIIIVIFRIKRTSLLTRIRWNPVPKKTYALVAAFTISNIIALNILMILLLPQNWVQGAEDYAAHFTSAGFLLNIVFAGLVGPLGEEVLMRGLMTTRLLKRLPLWFAIVFPTLLFGLAHAAGGMGQIIGTTVLGLLFALVFIWTNSLRAAFLAHALNNLFVMYIPLDVNDMSALVELMLGILAFAATIFFGVLIYKRRAKEIIEN